jgi:hypothetical protein
MRAELVKLLRTDALSKAAGSNKPNLQFPYIADHLA